MQQFKKSLVHQNIRRTCQMEGVVHGESDEDDRDDWLCDAQVPIHDSSDPKAHHCSDNTRHSEHCQNRNDDVASGYVENNECDGEH